LEDYRKRIGKKIAREFKAVKRVDKPKKEGDHDLVSQSELKDQLFLGNLSQGLSTSRLPLIQKITGLI